jgi:hypothetical protein
MVTISVPSGTPASGSACVRGWAGAAGAGAGAPLPCGDGCAALAGGADAAERAFVDRLDFHGGFVGFDLGDHVAGFDRVALFLVPFGKVALLHRGREGRHQHLDRHDDSLAALLRDYL